MPIAKPPPLAERLRLLRIGHGYSQYDVAKAVFGDENRQPEISKWEAGKHAPSRENLRKLASFFGADLATYTGQRRQEL